MRIFLLTIVCLDTRFYEVRAARDSCSAVISAIERYPQCGAITCKRIAA